MAAPPLATGACANPSDLSEPAKSTAAPTPPPDALAMALRAPASAGSNASAAPSFSAASRLALSMSATRIGLSVSARANCSAHHADAAEADDQQRSRAQVGQRLLDGAVAGEARAHQRAGDLRRDALHVEQVARMRHQHVRGVAAVHGDAERARRIAQVLVAARAQPALAAADPGIGRVALARLDALGLGARRLDRAGDLVAQREGQRAVAAHVELLAAAQVEVAVLQVEVGVAHAAMGDAQQHLGALRLGRRGLRGLQRLSIVDQRLARCMACSPSGARG